MLDKTRNFFVIEKQLSDEEMQPIKKNLFFMFSVLYMQGIWKFC